MNKPFFSIIVSTYNNGKYAKRCIESLKCQSFGDFECILVDDGSKDDTCELIAMQIAGDDRFTLVQCQHMGPQAAKNKGIELAKGRYITFPDADDYLTLNCLENCKMNITDQDVLIFGINNQFYKDGEMVKEEPLKLQKLRFENGNQVADWYIKNKKLLLYSAGNKMYRLDMLRENDIHFASQLKWGEDRDFNYKVVEHCKAVETLEEVHYNYRRVNEESLTSKFLKHHIDTVLYLHSLKMNTMLKMSTGTSEEEKNQFKKHDIQKEVYNAFYHIAEHYETLSDEVREDEISYISKVELPEYFYGVRKRDDENFIRWINNIVYKESEEIDITKFSKVLILGSYTCRHRINTAWEIFKDNPNIKYICCGGNPSTYKDKYGNSIKESHYMEKFLLEHGVEKENIIIENDSRNTYENLKYAYSQFVDKTETPAIVTADFHIKRVEEMLKQMNCEGVVLPSFGVNTRPTNWFKNTIGVEAIIKELFYLM